LGGFALAVYAIFLAFVAAWVGSLGLAAQRIGRLAPATSKEPSARTARRRVALS
jgi:hypothetical protein